MLPMRGFVVSEVWKILKIYTAVFGKTPKLKKTQPAFPQTSLLFACLVSQLKADFHRSPQQISCLTETIWICSPFEKQSYGDDIQAPAVSQLMETDNLFSFIRRQPTNTTRTLSPHRSPCSVEKNRPPLTAKRLPLYPPRSPRLFQIMNCQ